MVQGESVTGLGTFTLKKPHSIPPSVFPALPPHLSPTPWPSAAILLTAQVADGRPWLGHSPPSYNTAPLPAPLFLQECYTLKPGIGPHPYTPTPIFPQTPLLQTQGWRSHPPHLRLPYC